MSERMYWSVKAYNDVDGEIKLSEWAAGFNYQQAESYYEKLDDTNSFFKIEMQQDCPAVSKS